MMETDKPEGRMPPKVLYHYCSVDVFFSILKNRTIWLSDISKSNDSRELMWIKEQCKYYIICAWYRYANAREKAGMGQPDATFFQQVHLMSEKITKTNTSKSWVFCLSEKKDNLGQWRGYADDGAGVCIGFKTTFFETVDEIAEIVDEQADFLFRSVRYNDLEIEEFFQNTAKLSSINASMNPEEVISALEHAIQCTIWNAEFFKNTAFQEESEWRLAYTMSKADLLCGEKPSISDPENKLISTDVFHFSDYVYAVNRKRLVSHIEMKVPRIEQVITDIIIGPKSALSIEDVELFLLSIGIVPDADKNHRIKIEKSTISYR